MITIVSLTLTFTSKSGHSRLSGGVNYIVAPRPEIHLGLNDRYATRNEGLLYSTGNYSQYLVITYNRYKLQKYNALNSEKAKISPKNRESINI